MADIPSRFKLRRGTSAQWAVNPVLAAGEPGWETDTKKMRVGDGVTPFLSLPYIGVSTTFAAAASPTITGTATFSGVIALARGTAAAPTITVTGDTNTGIYFPAADQIGLATAGTLRATMNDAGNLIIGASALSVDVDNYAGNTMTPRLQINGAGLINTATVSTSLYSAAASGPSIVLSKSRGAAVGTHTIVVAEDVIGAVNFDGSDGAAFIVGAVIRAVVDGTPGVNDMPTRLEFRTTSDGGQTTSERLRITKSGEWGLGGANYGKTGLAITSNGANAAPTWQGFAPQAQVNYETTGAPSNFATGTFAALPVNTVKNNSLGLSLATNQITFTEAGTYYVEAIVTARNASGAGREAAIRLYNTTTSQVEVNGTGFNNSNATVATCHICGSFVVAANDVVELQGLASGTGIKNGDETDLNATNIYSIVKFWRIS